MTLIKVEACRQLILQQNTRKGGQKKSACLPQVKVDGILASVPNPEDFNPVLTWLVE